MQHVTHLYVFLTTAADFIILLFFHVTLQKSFGTTTPTITLITILLIQTIIIIKCFISYGSHTPCICLSDCAVCICVA